MGNAYYYNASARVQCLGMPDWGCEGQNKFSSAEECMSVCGGESAAAAILIFCMYV